MTLDKIFHVLLCSLCLAIFWVTPGIAAERTSREGAVDSGRRYGPTSPGGYYVRVEPRAIAMAHTQRPQVTVYIENRDGQPQDDVLVSFLPSEGTVITGESSSRGGAVRGTFAVGTGSDNPRSASILITVENVDVTVFVDIVPAVFGR